MALERIERIELDNYRAFEGGMSFRFVGPLTIIHGSNASGKSSLIRSIIDALTTDERGQHCVDMNRRNLAGARSMVDLQFYSGGELFRIKKRFMPDHTATSEFFPWGVTRVNQPTFSGINATRCALALSLPFTHFTNFQRGGGQPDEPRAICCTLLGEFISPAAIREMQQLLAGWIVQIFPFEVESRPVLNTVGRLTHLTQANGPNQRIDTFGAGLKAGLHHLHRMAESIVAANRCGFSRVVLFDDPFLYQLDQETSERILLLMGEVGGRENMQFIVTSNHRNPAGAGSFIHLG